MTSTCEIAGLQIIALSEQCIEKFDALGNTSDNVVFLYVSGTNKFRFMFPGKNTSDTWSLYKPWIDIPRDAIPQHHDPMEWLGIFARELDTLVGVPGYDTSQLPRTFIMYLEITHPLVTCIIGVPGPTYWPDISLTLTTTSATVNHCADKSWQLHSDDAWGNVVTSETTRFRLCRAYMIDRALGSKQLDLRCVRFAHVFYREMADAYKTMISPSVSIFAIGLGCRVASTCNTGSFHILNMCYATDVWCTKRSFEKRVALEFGSTSRAGKIHVVIFEGPLSSVDKARSHIRNCNPGRNIAMYVGEPDAHIAWKMFENCAGFWVWSTEPRSPVHWHTARYNLRNLAMALVTLQLPIYVVKHIASYLWVDRWDPQLVVKVIQGIHNSVAAVLAARAAGLTIRKQAQAALTRAKQSRGVIGHAPDHTTEAWQRKSRNLVASQAYYFGDLY